MFTGGSETVLIGDVADLDDLALGADEGVGAGDGVDVSAVGASAVQSGALFAPRRAVVLLESLNGSISISTNKFLICILLGVFETK